MTLALNDATAYDAARTCGALALHAQGFTGAGMKVAVLDSGINEIPALQGQIAGSYYLRSTNYADTCGHGTAVAALACAKDYTDLNGRRYIGTAPGAQLLNAKWNDYCVPTDWDAQVAAYDWAVAQGADVISLSQMFLDTIAILGAARIQAAYEDHGIITVSSAGNNGKNYGPNPDVPGLLVAGCHGIVKYAMWTGNTRATLPDYGFPHVLTPSGADGEKLWILGRGGSSQVGPGSSYAAPQLAGCLAVAKQYLGTLDWTDLKTRLRSAARWVVDPSTADLGSRRMYPFLDLQKMLLGADTPIPDAIRPMGAPQPDFTPYRYLHTCDASASDAARLLETIVDVLFPGYALQWLVDANGCTWVYYDPTSTDPSNPLGNKYDPKCVGGTFDFANSTVDPNGYPVDLAWDFGDGTTRAGRAFADLFPVVHDYLGGDLQAAILAALASRSPLPGATTRTVALKATNCFGQQATKSILVTMPV